MSKGIRVICPDCGDVVQHSCQARSERWFDLRKFCSGMTASTPEVVRGPHGPGEHDDDCHGPESDCPDCW